MSAQSATGSSDSIQNVQGGENEALQHAAVRDARIKRARAEVNELVVPGKALALVSTWRYVRSSVMAAVFTQYWDKKGALIEDIKSRDGALVPVLWTWTKAAAADQVELGFSNTTRTTAIALVTGIVGNVLAKAWRRAAIRWLEIAEVVEEGEVKDKPWYETRLHAALHLSSAVLRCVVFYPLEVAASRMTSPDYALYGNGMYSSLRATTERDGYGALFRGISLGIAGCVVSAVVSYGAFHGIRYVERKLLKRESASRPYVLFVRIAASIVGVLAALPINIVKGRVQTASTSRYEEISERGYVFSSLEMYGAIGRALVGGARVGARAGKS